MYEAFFGFRERPFHVTPDARYFFPSVKHREALDSLYYAVTQRLGFVVVTGEIGAGKTTVCRALLKRLPATTRVAIITNTRITPRYLMGMLLEELELPVGDRDPCWKLLSRLNEFLVEALARDENVVLVMDEAQNLTPSVLEEVRLLSNLETDETKLIQIVLVGQPELRGKLNLPQLAQLKQRIAVAFHLGPLSLQETEGYIQHRQVKAGATHSVFTPEAVEVIYGYSRGIPRLINLVCERALLAAYADEIRRIDGSFLKTVIDELLVNHAGWNPGTSPTSMVLEAEEESAVAGV